MLKTLVSLADNFIRTQAHQKIDRLDPVQVRGAIHASAPVKGRIYTAFTSTDRQRQRVHAAVDQMSPRDLRKAASDAIPVPVLKVLDWMD